MKQGFQHIPGFALVEGSLVVVKSAFDGNIRNVFNNEDVNGYDREGFRGMLDVDAEISPNSLIA